MKYYMLIVAIIQARMGSKRLPGKMFKFIKNKPLLWYTINRTKKSSLIDQVIIATSVNKENDIIEQFCKENDIKCFRGSEDDVLDRYYQCAKQINADIIVRITGDCPLIDPNVVDNCINFYKTHDHNYIKNTWFDNSYPSGFDVEIFNFKTLEHHWKTETNVNNREHVLYSHPNKYNYSDIDIKINNIQLSVDNQKDFNLIKNILDHFNDIDFTFYDVMKYLDNNVNLLE